MAGSGNGGCYLCCCKFIFSLGLTSLFMWLSLRTSNPKCYIKEFYLPAMNKSLNTPSNTTLQFQLKLANTNKDKGVYYDDVNITIFDASNGNRVIGNSLVTKFYQGHKKTAKKDGTATIDKSVVSRTGSGNGSVVFGVDLVTAVRFKIIAWQTKRHKIRVRANVTINDKGTKDDQKDIRLKSSSPRNISRYCVLVGVLFNFLALILLKFW